jgi:hypothetical protein
MIVWKIIFNFSDYAVSNAGVVKRVIPNKRGHRLPVGGKILAQQSDKDGYLKVTLFKNAVPKTCHVHRLIAQAFIPNPLNLPEVNHKKGEQKQNNDVSNLEWVTHSGNQQPAYDTGLKKGQKGSKNGTARLTTKDVQRMRKLHAAGHSIPTLAVMYDTSKANAHRAITGRTWTHA